MSKYTKINGFNLINEEAEKIVGNKKYVLNFDLKVELDAVEIENPIRDVTDLAKDFQRAECPETLFMNHGEFIHKKEDGIENVISELKEKESSNRAMVSLINQENIVNSEDKPIPSFMILQFSLEDKKLYVTAYFRALEVATFLKINAEEIRLIIKRIKRAFVKIKKIRLNILAFRAYSKPSINTLKRAEIDLLEQKDLLKFLKKDMRAKLVRLLNNKKEFSTVIELKSLKDIHSLLNDEQYSKFKDDKGNDLIDRRLINNKKLLSSKILKAIDNLEKLKKLRTKTSHDKEIDKLEEKYTNVMNEIIRLVRDGN